MKATLMKPGAPEIYSTEEHGADVVRQKVEEAIQGGSFAWGVKQGQQPVALREYPDPYDEILVTPAVAGG